LGLSLSWFAFLMGFVFLFGCSGPPSGSVWQLLFFGRARLQPCRNSRKFNLVLAAEGRFRSPYTDSSGRFLLRLIRGSELQPRHSCAWGCLGFSPRGFGCWYFPHASMPATYYYLTTGAAPPQCIAPYPVRSTILHPSESHRPSMSNRPC